MSEMSARSRFILEEHRQLRGAAGELRMLVAGCPECEQVEAVGPWFEELASVLSGFRESCRKHFEAEEHSDFMERLACKVESARPLFELLRAEHRAMLSEMDELLGAVLADASVEATVPVASRAASLLEVFERHERQENELLADLVREEFRSG